MAGELCKMAADDLDTVIVFGAGGDATPEISLVSSSAEVASLSERLKLGFRGGCFSGRNVCREASRSMAMSEGEPNVLAIS